MKSFFVITLRRLMKEKFYAFVCVLSLALGIAGSLIVSLYLLHELTFDRYHENHEKIYRVDTHLGSLASLPFAGYETTAALVRDNSQYLDYVRFREADEKLFVFGDNENLWNETFLVDESVFANFTFDVLYGDINTAFDDPYSIAISDTFAQFYFGDRDPIGELISSEQFEFRVTLVYQDLPNNVSHKYDALIPMSMLEIYQPDFSSDYAEMFMAMVGASYLIVPDNYDPDSIELATQSFFEDYMAEGFSRATGGVDIGQYRLELQKLSEIHFGPDMSLDGNGGYGDSGGNIVNVYLFSAVALALLAIGVINYINLATARASIRAKEIAMKKILGATRETLIKHFLLESLIFVIVAVWLGISLCSLALELAYIKSFVGGSELGTIFASPFSVLIFVLAVIFLAIASGLYPAFYLTRQSAISSLKVEQRSHGMGFPVRQLLVFAQLTASIIIVACVLIMLRQSDFLTNSPMGFKKSNQLVVQLRGTDSIRAREALINELIQHPDILQAVEMSSAFGRGVSNLSILPVDTNSGERRNLRMYGFNVGETFLEAMEIQLLQGTMFRRQQDSNVEVPALVNESFVKEMEWDKPLGKKAGNALVVGVVKDFHYMPLHKSIQPLILTPYTDSQINSTSESRRNRARVDLVISIAGAVKTETRDYIEEVTRRFTSQPVVEIVLLDDVWDELYADDTRAISLVGFFSFLCIIISLLGLAGLAAYNTELRGKEVAVRKVLGASLSNLLVLFSLDTIKVFAIATIPAAFGTYYLSDSWLQGFAYKADFSPLPYLASLSIIGVVSMAVMLLYTCRAAQSNPAKKLKYE